MRGAPSSPSSTHPRLGTRLAVLWFLLTTALLVWPLFPWLGNHVHPRVLGLPWSLVYVLGVIALNFIALLVLHRLRVVDDREHEEPEGSAQDQAMDPAQEGDAP